MIQKDPKRARWEQRTQAISLLMVGVLILLLIQLWLITIALEEFLAARTGLAIPTFLASGACFLLNLGMLKYLNDLDKKED